MALEKIVYTAHAVATGGRDGSAKSDNGKLDVKLDLPKEMGGGDNGTNPEQLFAAGYAACFIGAMKFVAGTRKIELPADTSINSSVAFGPRTGGAKGFSVDVALEVHIPGMEHAEAEKLVHEAHEVCPYSNATRNNIDVKLTVA
ncbi:organic hydroperoxide resistance protein [Acidipila sp. EB88]|uniref:organic hydroperoxide resistance protein n=1 Tax=Acidipila sp. EB88 TaxID=2305226 RepID=UPI000F5FD865|nr:organic hydroperoxide resistance protein [Acidipila sp. EB88]RRA48144.1 organic hydroperoxide resistance protein [Acidipila sp. EB88]